MQAIGHCRDAGIAVQINMSVMRSAIGDVEGVIGLGTSLGVRDYQLFFPIPTGRARQIGPCSPEEYEELIRRSSSVTGTPVSISARPAPRSSAGLRMASASPTLRGDAAASPVSPTAGSLPTVT